MGKKAAEALEINYDELADYLHCNHSVYMKVDGNVYYLTDVNFESWRAQDTSRRNSKNHFVDCSPLVPTVDEFLALPFIHGKTIKDVFSDSTFYASLSNEKSA
ncbi:CDP-alcohol phosphatidyltransferase [uncultured Olegusella sp.]|uniref:CDP-alcohol phosphatidyltransferase n=1 Tax=uncultured Olegusella sp. TaxID=1979846 RepID=UPI00262C8027|nr:CDP-alcohol phosphatidyltransferase [uncultured Olegusella sp.]